MTTPIDDEEWRGGFYELAICLGEPDDARLADAASALARAARMSLPDEARLVYSPARR